MDKSSGGKEIIKQQPQGPEQEGIQVERISADELELNEEVERGILSLEYSALDTNKKRNREVRKDSLKGDKLHDEHLKSSARGEVLVARDKDRIVGVLTMNRAGGVGVIDDLWVAFEADSEQIIEKLLQRAKKDLNEGSAKCDGAIIKADRPSEEMRRVYHDRFDAHSRTFFTLEAKDN